MDQALILLAVVAITGERLTRTDLPEDLKVLETPLPAEYRGECNISSIAAATGLNRETTRRKVNALVDSAYLIRSPAGEIAFSPAISGSDAMARLMRKQLEAVTRFVNDALRDGVFRAA
jgi:DNA-binding IclR family transcriptional regulator